MGALFRRIVLAIVVVTVLKAVLLSECKGVAQTNAELSFDPKLSGRSVGETFSANITITDVSELFIWQINVSFNPAVLQAISVVEGPFLKQAGKTIKPGDPVINNDTGWMVAGWNLFPYPEHGASGSGVLATVTFKVVAEGKCSLHYVVGAEAEIVTKLRTWNADTGGPESIAFESIDGAFGYPRDVAVTGIVPSPASVRAGDSVSIDVSVMNKGSLIDEAFDVTLSYDSETIGTQSVSDLAPGASQVLTFNWETKNVEAGDYVLTATALDVSGDVSTADNSFSDVVVSVTASALPLELLIAAGAVVVVVVVGLVVFYVKRKSKR